jgi:hypothetical protein
MHSLKNTIFVGLLLLLCSFDGAKLVKTRVAPGVVVSLPAGFVPMTDDDIARKYPSFRRPTAMYTSTDRNVDFGFNQTETRWRQQDLAMLKDFYKSSILAMHTKVDFIQETVATVNKRDFLVFEFVSEVADDSGSSLSNRAPVRQYSYIQYTVEGNKILIFNFTCPGQLRERWQDVARNVMASIKVSGK